MGTKKLNRDKLRDEKITRLLEIQQHGYSVKHLTDTQYRVNGRLDIYIMNCKYHDVKTNKRGTYNNDPVAFILAYDFKTPAVEEPHYILRPKNNRPRDLKKELQYNKSKATEVELFGGRKIIFV